MGGRRGLLISAGGGWYGSLLGPNWLFLSLLHLAFIEEDLFEKASKVIRSMSQGPPSS